MKIPGSLKFTFPVFRTGIILPPSDYDSWLLGHIIFTPETGADSELECGTICGMIGVEIDA